MKKAKMILFTIGLLSLIGGMFAFKAQHRNCQYKCGSTATYCPYGTYATTPGIANSSCTLSDAPGTSCILTRAVTCG